MLTLNSWSNSVKHKCNAQKKKVQKGEYYRIIEIYEYQRPLTVENVYEIGNKYVSVGTAHDCEKPED